MLMEVLLLELRCVVVFASISVRSPWACEISAASYYIERRRVAHASNSNGHGVCGS